MQRRNCFGLIIALALCSLTGCGEDSPQKLLLEGMQKAARGDDAAALKFLNHAVATAPNDASLLIVRGGLHDSLGNTLAAIADYEKAIALAPHLEPGIAAQLEYLREQVAAPKAKHSGRVTFVPAPK